jgi:hypothetical protein
MRTITRNVLIALVVIVILLIALGALPGLLKSGDPFYVSATPVAAGDVGENLTDAIDAANLSERRHEYTTAALADAEAANGTGYSAPYWNGPVGIKGAFTHSPFDELSSLGVQYPNATDGERALVRNDSSIYLIEITQDNG